MSAKADVLRAGLEGQPPDFHNGAHVVPCHAQHLMLGAIQHDADDIPLKVPSNQIPSSSLLSMTAHHVHARQTLPCGAVNSDADGHSAAMMI